MQVIDYQCFEIVINNMWITSTVFSTPFYYFSGDKILVDHIRENIAA